MPIEDLVISKVCYENESPKNNKHNLSFDDKT